MVALPRTWSCHTTGTSSSATAGRCSTSSSAPGVLGRMWSWPATRRAPPGMEGEDKPCAGFFFCILHVLGVSFFALFAIFLFALEFFANRVCCTPPLPPPRQSVSKESPQAVLCSLHTQQPVLRCLTLSPSIPPHLELCKWKHFANDMLCEVCFISFFFMSL